MQAGDRINALRFDYLKPNGRGGDPALNKRRRHRAGKFRLNGDRNDHSLKHAGKQIDVPDQDEIVYGAGVGYDQLHKLKAQAFQVGDIAIDIFDRDVFIHAVRLEEAIDLQTG